MPILPISLSSLREPEALRGPRPQRV